MGGELKGWQRDPFGLHEFRFFSDDGKATQLVRDGDARSYDKPPTGAAATLVGVSLAAGEQNEPVPSGPVQVPVLPAEPAVLPPEPAFLPPEPVLLPPEPAFVPPEPTNDETQLPSFWVEPAEYPSDPGGGTMPLLSRTAKVAYVLVLAAMAVSGLALLVEHVGGGKTPASASSSSTTTTVKTGGTTTTGISTTTSPVPSAPQPSAATAAAALISSWASGNQAEALTVATPPAVATLFAVHYTSGLAIDRGCSVANTIVCTYGPPGGAAPTDSIYEIYVSQAGADWYVNSVRIEN